MSIVTLNDRGVRSVTTFGSLNAGAMVFIKKLTASSSSTLSFVNGSSSAVLDSTYKEYLFTFKDIHPATNGASLQFNMSADSGSNYNVTKTSNSFRAFQNEAGSSTALAYFAANDLAQGTGYQTLFAATGTDNDQSASGCMYLFNPSSTTFVKHFLAQNSTYSHNEFNYNEFTAGYFNTTSAIDEIQFKMSGGNIDAGTFKLYGLKDS